MELDDLFVSSRWQILQSVACEPCSPVQIAEKIGTSVAYVSQQLKLLEAARIVVRKKTGAADKGKPRAIYSIEKDILNVTALMNKLPLKKQIYPTEHQKAVLRIWALENAALHYPLEKLYWKLEPYLSKVDAFYVDVSDSGLNIEVVSKDKKVAGIVDAFSKEEGLRCKVLTDLKNFDKAKAHAIFELGSEVRGKQNEVKT